MFVDNSPGVLSQPVGCEQTKRLLGSFHPHCKLYEILEGKEILKMLHLTPVEVWVNRTSNGRKPVPLVPVHIK